MKKSKSLKAVQGTLRPDRDITPMASTVDRSDFPDPIIELNESARHFYDLTIEHLNDASVLYQVDAMLLSVLAKNIDIMIQASNEIKDLEDVVQEFDSGATNITGTFTAFERAVKNVLTLSAKLGLSPADREKLMSFSNLKKMKVDPYDMLKSAATG
jgi:phage terminase small subunit|tara:strand:- start:6247 stop:6717 length:471 start_codon:yes stop_codon:yes gene_type:complete